MARWYLLASTCTVSNIAPHTHTTLARTWSCSWKHTQRKLTSETIASIHADWLKSKWNINKLCVWNFCCITAPFWLEMIVLTCLIGHVTDTTQLAETARCLFEATLHTTCHLYTRLTNFLMIDGACSFFLLNTSLIFRKYYVLMFIFPIKYKFDIFINYRFTMFRWPWHINVIFLQTNDLLCLEFLTYTNISL